MLGWVANIVSCKVMKSISKLCWQASHYHMLCQADLRTDMAKRIMYSILPSVAPQSQVHMTGGVVDMSALKMAIEGRKDIIKYGTQACLDELQHGSGIVETYNEQAVSAFSAKRYAEVLDLCMRGFTEKGWVPGYGGEAWYNIAKTIKQIDTLDKNLQMVRAYHDPSRLNHEIQIMQQLVIAMNVFDGLTHNTGGVINKLINLEAEERGEPTTGPKSFERESELQRVMDAKEIQDPISVFKEIEPILQESGDIHRFKDWISKIKSQPTYQQRDPNLVKEKSLIRLRKEIAPAKTIVYENYDKFRQLMAQLQTIMPSWLETAEESVFNNYMGQLIRCCSHLQEALAITSGAIRRIIYGIDSGGKNAELYAIFERMDSAIQSKMDMATYLRSHLVGISNGNQPRQHIKVNTDRLAKEFSSTAIYLDSI